MKQITVELATAHGCSKCSKAIGSIDKMVDKRQNIDVEEVNIALHPEFAIKHGIMSTPAIIINGKLEFKGIPKPIEFEKALRKYEEE